MTSRLVARLIVISVAAMVVLPSSAYAQEAVITGTVTDTTGGVLPGVVVRAVNDANGNSFEAVTDGGGAYRLPVRVGSYTTHAELAGFATTTRSGLQMLVGQQVVLNLQMQPATLAESVTVTAQAPLIDVSKSSLGVNIDPRQMQELPVNGRNWMDLTMLAAGSRSNSVAETPTPGTLGNGITGNFQLNLDGQQVTQIIAYGFGQPRYSRDSIGEFQFVSNRFDASQGRSMGAQVNAITKSGTNTPAGSFSGYFRNDSFNAADHVAHRVLPYSDQQLSGTFGGPLRRDRAHVFGSYEYEREPQSYVYTTPYPKFNGTLTAPRKEKKALVRLDFQYSPATRLSVRGNQYDNDLPYDPRYTGGADKTVSSAIATKRHSEQLFITLTHTFGARAVNEAKVGSDWFHWDQHSHTKWTGNTRRGMDPGMGAPVVRLRGLTIGQSHQLTPQNLDQNDYLLRDDFTFSFSGHGRHDVKMGGEYLYDFTAETVCFECMGLIDATGGPIPANIQDLFPDIFDVSTWNLAPLSPITRQVTIAIPVEKSTVSRPPGAGGFTEYAPRHVIAGWVQDDWIVGSKLTLNLGLRYDLAVNAFANWLDLAPFFSANRPNDTNNWGPRLGFAYTVEPRTVIRGGFGKYFAEVSAQPAIFSLRAAQQVHPQILNDGRSDFAANPFNGPTPTYAQALQLLCAARRVPGCLRPSPALIVAPDLQVPYSYQASIGVQRQIRDTMAIEADYVFVGERAVFASRNINLAFDPATGANYPFTDISKLPYPDWGNVAMNRADSRDDLHQLQVTFTKRMANRWQASATYSLSGQWNFDHLPLNPGCTYPVTIAASGAFRCDTPITLASDIAENAWYLTGDQRHRATFNGIWDLGHGFQWSGLYIFGDQGWATPVAGVDARRTGGTLGASTDRLRPNGTIIPRNSLDLPTMHRVDTRIQRHFALGRVGLDGIIEVFNLFNHANYDPAGVVTNESNPRFGQPTQTPALAYSPRMVQLGFRATF